MKMPQTIIQIRPITPTMAPMTTHHFSSDHGFFLFESLLVKIFISVITFFSDRFTTECKFTLLEGVGSKLNRQTLFVRFDKLRQATLLEN